MLGRFCFSVLSDLAFLEKWNPGPVGNSPQLLHILGVQLGHVLQSEFVESSHFRGLILDDENII